MNEEIRLKLRECVSSMMDKYNMNWYNIQEKGALKKIGCPVGFGTLRKLMKNDTYEMTINKQSKLLAYYKVKHEKEFGTIKLK